MKEYTEESILLRADEELKNSKGFILFTVNTQGDMTMVADTTRLTHAELWGIHAYRKLDSFDTPPEEDEEL